jgi:hypothetical protein
MTTPNQPINPLTPPRRTTGGAGITPPDHWSRSLAGRWDRRRLVRQAMGITGVTVGALGAGTISARQAAAQATPVASPGATPLAQPGQGSLQEKGISYEVGVDWAINESSRPTWDIEVVRHDIETIRNDLHCNAISIFGTESERAIEAGAIAQEVGLDVWLQPRLPDGDMEATMEQLRAFAQGAEQLRQANPNVVLNTGCELTIFMSGIIPGDTYIDRLGTLGTNYMDMDQYSSALNDFLGEATEMVRGEFGGDITYGSGLWEGVDWGPFDIIGLDHYRSPMTPGEEYARALRPFVESGKPVVITEFGLCTFEGASELGGSGFTIVDWSTDPPTIPAGYVRSAEEQATDLMAMLDVFEAGGVRGAFVFTFIEPTYTYSPDPTHDLDMASFGVVKAFPADSGQGYNETGYWEPKLAFHAIAERYGPE